jgi:hypothetical protein
MKHEKRKSKIAKQNSRRLHLFFIIAHHCLATAFGIPSLSVCLMIHTHTRNETNLFGLASRRQLARPPRVLLQRNDLNARPRPGPGPRGSWYEGRHDMWSDALENLQRKITKVCD